MKTKHIAIVSLMSLMTLFLSVLPARADEYGADAITNLFSGLWNSWWPLIALLFIIGIILSLFKGPGWLEKVFSMGRK